MKEQTLIEMKNKIDSMTRVLQHLINETTHLRELGVGTLETLKLMPDYQDAIDKLKKKMEENVEEKKKAEKNGTSK
jgi:peptidyl-tRNA hydrolase